jgi:hypothetical protein
MHFVPVNTSIISTLCSDLQCNSSVCYTENSHQFYTQKRQIPSSNCFIQQQLIYFLTMDQYSPKHAGVSCFKNIIVICDNCGHLLVNSKKLSYNAENGKHILRNLLPPSQSKKTPTLTIEAGGFSTTVIPVYQTTQQHIPQA